MCQKACNASLLDPAFQSHGFVPVLTGLGPNQIPGAFRTFGRLCFDMFRIVVLTQAVAKAVSLAAIITATGLTSNDIDRANHTRSNEKGPIA
jgi:hypothetical protein